MYLYYNKKKTPKIFNSFFKKITEIHSYNTRQVSHSTFFYRECQKHVLKTQFRTKVQRFGQN